MFVGNSAPTADLQPLFRLGDDALAMDTNESTNTRGAKVLTGRTIVAGIVAGLLAMGGGFAIAGAQGEAPGTTAEVAEVTVPEAPEVTVPEVELSDEAADAADDAVADDAADAAEDAAEAAEEAAEDAAEAELGDAGRPEGVTTGRPDKPGRPDGVGPPDSVGNPIADAARRGPEFPAECGNFGRWVSAQRHGVACTPPSDGLDD